MSIEPEKMWNDQKIVNQYLKEIRPYKLVNKAEERVLLARIKKGDLTARNALICANLRFVVSVAVGYQHLGLGMPELINEGNLGLIEAAQRFDLESTVRFLSYAVWWVRQSIVRAIYEKGRLVRVSAEREAKLKKLNNLLDRHLQDNDGLVNHKQLGRQIKTNAADVASILTLNRRVASLSDPVDEEEGRTLIDVLPNQNAVDPEADLTQEYLRNSIDQVLG